MSPFPTHEVTLKRSKIVATIPEDWHISDTTAAQRYGKGDVSKVNLFLIQRVCLFDGQKLTFDEITDKIKGKDFIQLQGELFGDDEDAEGGEGND
ncbi:MAG TPA: hypothetical protein VIQ29_04290 [Ancylobacter sp.]